MVRAVAGERSGLAPTPNTDSHYEGVERMSRKKRRPPLAETDFYTPLTSEAIDREPYNRGDCIDPEEGPALWCDGCGKTVEGCECDEGELTKDDAREPWPFEPPF